MRINHNIMALNAHRSLTGNNTQSAKNLEKLSSGFRINRAGDDAAGLAISEKMRSQIRGLDMAAKNSQDAISLIQTAEGALTETHSILQRMRELAVQAATDTNTTKDREEIQKEINQLTSEINRIANTTEFNTKKLLNGELSTQFETAPAVAGTFTSGDAVDVTKAITQEIKVGYESITWDNDSSAKFDVIVAGTANNGFDWTSLASGAANIVIGRSGNDFTVSFSGTDSTGKTLNINAELVSFDAASGKYSYENQGINFSFTTADIANWDNGDKVTIEIKQNTGAAGTGAGTHNTEATRVPLTVSGTSGSASTMSNITVDSGGLLLEGVDGMKIEWDQGAGTSGQFKVELLAGSGVVSTTTFSLTSGQALNFDADGIKFTFNASGNETGDAKVTGSFNFEMRTDNVQTSPDVTTPGTAAVTEDRSAIFQVGANKNQAIALSIESMSSKALGISKDATGAAGFLSGATVSDGMSNNMGEFALDFTTQKSANDAIDVLDKAIAMVSTERAKLGSVQNRLEYTINNLGAASENLTAAEARIRDVDMAKEMMEFTKNSILTQAAQAMLAQANQQPQGVLQLLR